MTPGGINSEAQDIFRRAKAYYSAPSVRKHKAGFELLKQAAALGNVDAHEWLGALYDYGLGTKTNRRRAFEHYLVAAKAANPNSEYHIGIFYYAGIGVRKNRALAVEWLQKAVRHADADAMHVLGKCYRYGHGVPKNPEKGFRLELKAAQRSILEAQFSVGVRRPKGTTLVFPSRDVAKKATARAGRPR
jgi:TPR repeat protein